MAEYPVLPLWVQDYLAGTFHLTTEQHGALLLMLANAWLQPDGRLPNDDHLLAQLTRCTPKKWEKIKPAIMPYWTVVDGRLSNKRLEKERAKVIDNKKKQDAARKSHTVRRLKNNDSGDAAHPSCNSSADVSLALTLPRVLEENNNRRDDSQVGAGTDDLPPGPECVDPETVKKLVSKAVKMTNPNYRAVVDGDVPSHAQREERRRQQRIHNDAFKKAYGGR
ncbi:MAG: DUF1376 domain-containing protein [Rhodospirillaceae bacterium]